MGLVDTIFRYDRRHKKGEFLRLWLEQKNGLFEGQSIERLVVDVRVPPETIVKCLEAFSFANNISH